MKKFYIPYIITLFGILILFAVISFERNDEIDNYDDIISDNSITKPKEHNDISTDIDDEKAEVAERYMVRTDNNDNKRICVFDSDGELLEILNIDYYTLREYDKQLFDKGIIADSIEDVYHIAEDFTS